MLGKMFGKHSKEASNVMASSLGNCENEYLQGKVKMIYRNSEGHFGHIRFGIFQNFCRLRGILDLSFLLESN